MRGMAAYAECSCASCSQLLNESAPLLWSIRSRAAETLMPTIFLDTSTLSLLADCLRKDRPRFDQFQTFWRAKECVAAFSMSVLSEIRQHGMAVAREERYAVLGALTPICTDLPPREDRGSWPLVPGDREVARAILQKGSGNWESSLSARKLKNLNAIFPWTTASGWSVQDARKYEDPSFSQALAAAQQIVMGQAAELTRQAGSAHKRLRFADLPSDPVPEEEVRSALAAIDQIISNPAELALAYPRLSAPMRVSRANAERAVIKASGEIGLARAHAKSLGARGEKDKNQIDRYLFAHAFRQRVEEVACTLGLERVEDVRSAAESIAINDCPGWWLWQHSQLAFRVAEASPKLGDFFDLEHLLYFPYVDVLFADKRTVAYAGLALRDRQCPQTLIGRTPPIAISGKTVDSVEQALNGIQSVAVT